MFIINQPALAYGLCLLTMFCWGSWTNAQKSVTQSAPLYVFYRDYIFGILLVSLVLAFTLGSFGEQGRSVINDLQQAELRNVLLALAGGIVFNIGNMLLTVGISLAGISIAMPVGTGLSLAIGLVINYLAEPKGSVPMLAIGGGAILGAMLFSALAYQTKQDKVENQEGPGGNKGIWIALVGGLVAGFFFRLISASLVKDLSYPETGFLTPYTGFALFAIGLAISNSSVEYLVRRFALPDQNGQPNYQTTGRREHLIGLSGGLLWGIGMIALLIGSKQAGDAVSYGLSQGATIISVFWGVFFWKEFKDAPPKASRYLWLMGVAYLAGLVLISLAIS